MVCQFFTPTFLLYWLSILSMLSVIGCAPGPKAPVTPINNSLSEASPVAEINRMLASAAAIDRTSSADYQLGPEDMLQITVFNLQGIEGGVTPKDIQVRVSQKGLIKLPLLGEVKVAGLSTSSLEDLLRQRYEKFIRDPEIGVMVKEFRSQRVYLLGAVNRAGAIDLTGPKSLIDVLAMAGGVSPRAGNQVHIYRETPDGRKSYVMDLFALASSVGLINDKTVESVNLPVQAGDIINVPEAGMFFVDGAVGRA